MDLTLSPDVDAQICYAIAFLTGIGVAVFHVRGLFGTSKFIWLIIGSWSLLLAYALVPVCLLWMLDRASVVNDTSIFAALLLGFGYQQIITGQSASVKAPTNISALWTPFLAWAEKIASTVRDAMQLADKEFRDFLVQKASQSDEAIQPFLDLAIFLTSNLAGFQAKLVAIDNSAPVLGSKNVLSKKAQLSIDEISLAADYVGKLRNSGLISKADYFRRASGWNWRWGFRTMLYLFVVLIVAVGAVYFAARPETRIQYLIWRLGKPNSTKADQFRARECLAGYLANNSSGPVALKSIAFELKRPGYSTDRTGLFLQLLLQHRRSGEAPKTLPGLLIDALHAESVDSRVRVHSALLMLARELPSKPKVTETLKGWKPADGDRVDELEERIKEWQSVFATAEPAPPSSS
jgi:hypothetical protein